MGIERLEQLRAFITASPADPFPRYALALELKSRGDAAGATRELSSLLASIPDYLAAYLQLGMLHEQQGDTARAKTTYLAGCDLARRQGNSHALSELSAAAERLAG